MPVTKRPRTRSDQTEDGATGAASAKRGAKTKAAGKPGKDSGAAKPGGAGRKSGPAALRQAGLPSKARPRPNPARGAAQAAGRSAALKAMVLSALDDMKALDIKVLDVRGLTDVADTMVIASGTSDRHVRSVAQKLVEKTKAAGFRPHGVEGQQDSDWVLIDLNEMIVHVMLPRVREFYGLEKLWDMGQPKRAARA